MYVSDFGVISIPRNVFPERAAHPFVTYFIDFCVFIHKENIATPLLYTVVVYNTIFSFKNIIHPSANIIRKICLLSSKSTI